MSTCIANPYDTHLNRATMAIEIYDTRTGKVVDFFFIDNGGAQALAGARCDALWHAELLRQAETHPEQPDEPTDDTCVCPDCGEEFAAPAGVLVSDASDEDGALHLICPDCAAPGPDDDTAPAPRGKRLLCVIKRGPAFERGPTPPSPPDGLNLAEFPHLTGPASSHITGNLAQVLASIGPDAELQAVAEQALASIGVRCRLPIADGRAVRRWRLTQGQAVSLTWWLRAQLNARDAEARPMGLAELGALAARLSRGVQTFQERVNRRAAA